MKYIAFISYSSEDLVWGRKLQRKLEAYRLPVSMCKEKGWKRHPLRPVFFAPSDIQPGSLSEELKYRLSESQNLIVICSPSSAQSTWVGEEIRYFYSLGRQDHILFFIVDGTPNSGNHNTECFHPILKSLGIPEILGANVHEHVFRSAHLNTERTYIQIISKLLGVDFDTLWRRDRKRSRKQMALAGIGVASIILSIVFATRYVAPVDLVIEFQEYGTCPENLPALGDIQYSVVLENETKAGYTEGPLAVVHLPNIPKNALRHPSGISARAEGFFPLDTSIKLSRKTVIQMQRDPDTYGAIRFVLWNPDKEETAPQAAITVDGWPVRADENGTVVLSIPLEKQKTEYIIRSKALQLSDSLVHPSAGEGYVVLFSNKNVP